MKRIFDEVGVEVMKGFSGNVSGSVGFGVGSLGLCDKFLVDAV